MNDYQITYKTDGSSRSAYVNWRGSSKSDAIKTFSEAYPEFEIIDII